MERLVLVTGANRGIGLAVSKRLLATGHRVVMTGRDLDAVKSAIDGLDTASEGAVSLEMDVTSASSVHGAVKAIARRFGRIDGLVNNAGIFEAHRPLEFPESAARSLFDTNVFGAWRLTVACLDLLAASAMPSIVNLSSTTASLELTASGFAITGNAERRIAYCCSKAALNMLTIQMAKAFERDPRYAHIRINAVSPGYVATRMNDFTGDLDPAEPAEIIARYATLDISDHTGRFVHQEGQLPW
jgi:NAD(P)-dependent dehydrogenase (short-subunit alcohol dehydrogenase family)